MAFVEVQSDKKMSELLRVLNEYLEIILQHLQCTEHLQEESQI